MRPSQRYGSHIRSLPVQGGGRPLWSRLVRWIIYGPTRR